MTSVEHNGCPDESTLWLLINGMLDPSEANACQTHIDSCEICLSAVAALMRSGGGPHRNGSEPARPVGELIAGRYRVEEELGSGAMAVVFRAIDTQLERPVALKILRSSTDAATDRAERLLRESKAMASLRHSNVARVFDAFVDEGRVVLVMELCEGGTLRTWAESSRPWRELCRILLEAARGLEAVHHAGWIHRDFKPDNVLLDAHERAMVSDFGMVRALEFSDQTTAGPVDSAVESATTEVLGTPVYMSPEQATGMAVDARTDVYAFCVTAYELLTRRRPFIASSYAELITAKRRGEFIPIARRAAPAAVRRIVHAGLSATPELRPASIGAVRKVFESALVPRNKGRVISLLGAAAIVAVIGTYVVALDDDQRCQELNGEELWTASRRDDARRQWSSDERMHRVEPALERFVTTWTEEWNKACATESLQRECLKLQHVSVDASVGALSSGSLPPDFVLADIPSVNACTTDDVAVLRQRGLSGADRARRNEVRASVAAAWRMQRDDLAKAAHELERIEPQIVQLGDAWVAAEFYFALGETEDVRQHDEAAKRAYGQALDAAAKSGHVAITVRTHLALAGLAASLKQRGLVRARLDDATSALHRAKGIPLYGALDATLNFEEGEAALDEGDLARARRHFERAIDQARTHRPRALATWLIGLARVEADEGNVLEATARLEEALAISDGLLPLTRGEVELDYAWLLYQTERFDASLQRLQRAKLVDDGAIKVRAGLMEIEVLLAMARTELAQKRSTVVMKQLERYPDLPVALRVAAALQAADVARAAGHYSQCIAAIRELRTYEAFENDSLDGVNAQLVHVDCLLELEQYGEALIVADAAVADSGRVQNKPGLESLALATRALALLHRGKHDRALADIDEAQVRLPRSSESESLSVYFDSVRARVLWALGNTEAAKSLAFATFARMRASEREPFELWMRETVGVPTIDPKR